MAEPKTFDVFIAKAADRRMYLPLPFDPGTKRRPEVRAGRIAELVALLKAGRKARPSS